jgi:hypothetical protein
MVGMDPAGHGSPIREERRRLDPEQLSDLRTDEREPIAADTVSTSRPRDPLMRPRACEPGALGLDLVELLPATRDVRERTDEPHGPTAAVALDTAPAIVEPDHGPVGVDRPVVEVPRPARGEVLGRLRVGSDRGRADARR